MQIYDNLKKNVNKNVDYYMSLVKSMYDNPEVGNEEFETMELLCNALCNLGFEVKKEFIVPTGFIGEYSSHKTGPTIAFLCEYDALPEIGHGCGHNLIAGIGIASGTALKSVIDDIGGTVLIVGTPAEENFGGKVSMAEAGVFDKVDVALMLHPSTINSLGGKTQALNPIKFEFFGKNAHGCTPQEGKSALDAAVLSYININLLRQFTKENTHIHGIFKNGGSAANVIPAYASLEYYFRGETMNYVQELSKKAMKCVEGACLATDTSFKSSIYECPYEDMLINYELTKLLKKKYEELGLKDIEDVDETPTGSTDMGSVSYKCPSLHGYIKIADSSVNGHSKEMAQATISLQGKAALINGAYALSSIAVDLICNDDLLKKVKDEFKKSTEK